MDPVRWLDPREERAWRALQFMQLQVDGELARRLAAESNLSYSDYMVLVALTDEPDGWLRLFELAAVTGWEKSRVSHHIRRMAERGLVTKRKCASDGRGAIVAITELGRSEIEAAAPGHLRAVRELCIDHLSDQQLDAIADVAETVLAALHGNDPVPAGDPADPARTGAR